MVLFALLSTVLLAGVKLEQSGELEQSGKLEQGGNLNKAVN